MRAASEKGFSLLEALIAATLFAGAIGSLVYVVTQSAAQSSHAQRAVVAATLAQSKLEELRAAEFAFDSAGVRIDSAMLAPAPDTMSEDSPPHVELLDRHGASVSGQDAPTFRRRWSVAQGADLDTLTIAVCVFSTDVRTNGVDACVWTLRVRRP
jgi:type II secretory pathway pseudopilin PulG